MNTDDHEERARHILNLLLCGEREIAAEKGFDLDEVLAEAEALLRIKPQ